MMKNEPATTNGHEIRNRRKKSGLNLRQLATKAGITESYLCKIERGAKQGAPATVLAIARALGASFEDITSDQLQGI